MCVNVYVCMYIIFVSCSVYLSCAYARTCYPRYRPTAARGLEPPTIALEPPPIALYVSDDTHTYASRTQTRMQLHACTFTFTLNPRPSTQTLF